MRQHKGHTHWFAAPLLLIGLTYGCGDSPTASNASSSPPARAVRVEVVAPQEVTSSLRVPGLVEAAARIELAFRVTGFVARFDLEGNVLDGPPPEPLTRFVVQERGEHVVVAQQGVDIDEALKAKS